MTQRRTTARKRAADDKAAEQPGADAATSDSSQPVDDQGAEPAADDKAAEQPGADGDLVTVRILTGVSGLDFNWKRGDEIPMTPAEADKWADGYRAELVD